MSRTAGVVIGWIGGALLLAGVVVGFLPTSAGGASCGSAFLPSSAARVADFRDALTGATGDRAATCVDRRSLLRVPAVALLVIGGGLGLAGWHVAGTATTARRLSGR